MRYGKKCKSLWQKMQKLVAKKRSLWGPLQCAGTTPLVPSHFWDRKNFIMLWHKRGRQLYLGQTFTEVWQKKKKSLWQKSKVCGDLCSEPGLHHWSQHTFGTGETPSSCCDMTWKRKTTLFGPDMHFRKKTADFLKITAGSSSVNMLDSELNIVSS